MAPAPNGRRIACVGGGPASLTVARDLAVTGYEVTLIDQDPKLGGMIRTQIQKFRLPESVIDEEVGHITGIGGIHFETRRIDSLKELRAGGWDAALGRASCRERGWQAVKVSVVGVYINKKT